MPPDDADPRSPRPEVRPRHRRTSSRAASRRRLGRRVGLGLCLAAVLAGLAIAANIGWFYLHSHTAGEALIHRERALDAAGSAVTSSPAGPTSSTAARPASAPACHAPPLRPGDPRGLVEAPSIGLVAPVLDGVGDAQLNVAVGHVPASAWPGPSGTTVLSAHDVSWFSHIDGLGTGATIRYVTPCQTFTYRVTGHRVVASGSPVDNTAAPRLVLVTCYPLDALYITPRRYLVYAELTGTTAGGRTASLPSPGAGSLSVALPSPVASAVEGSLTTTAPLGTLQLAGSPSSSWAQSLAPIHAEESALTLYFGALQLAEQHDAGAWHTLAPGVPLFDAAPLEGAAITHYLLGVTPTLTVSGSTITAVQLDAGFQISGGPVPGTYHITVDATAANGALTMTGWQMGRQ